MSMINNLKEVINLVQELGNKELYEKVLELQREIQELKQQNINYQEKIINKNQKIKELEEKFKLEKGLIYKEHVYYKSDGEGEPIGDPYCPRCWDSNKELIHLSPYRGTRHYYVCHNCDAKI